MKEYIVGLENEHSHALDVCYKEELIRCKDCKQFDRYTTAPRKYRQDGFCRWWERETYHDYWCCGAKRKEE